MVTIKITYPDNTVEYWYESISKFHTELKRLQTIHNNKIKFEFIDNPLDQETYYGNRTRCNQDCKTLYETPT